MNEYIKNSFILSTTPLILKILKFKSYPTPWSDSNLQAMKKKSFLSSETGPWWQNQISLLSVSRWQQIVTDGNIKNGGGLHLGVS